MTSLSLRLHKQSVATSLGAVATLQRVADESGEALARGRRIELTIPANSGGTAQNVKVEPGRWLVEATLPSGEMISEEVAVKSGQTLPVNLHSAEPSPGELLGLQYLVGNIEGAQTLRRLRDNPLYDSESLSKDATLNSSADREARRTSASISPPEVHIWKIQSGPSAIDAWTNIFSPNEDAFSLSSPTWHDDSRTIWLYRANRDACRNVKSGLDRVFAHIEWLGERFAVSLPLPWSAVVDQRLVPVQVMVHLEPRQDNIKIGVIVEDPNFASMAGLMTASTLPKAVVAVKEAEKLLFGKLLNPLAAAAGGYVLLAAAESKDLRWHAWIDNLANWFPEIPDGSILKASLRLRFPKNKKSSEEARASLLEAFKRGIPYYSAGVSWLLDGLTQFADDAAVADRLRVVHRLALRLDLSQAFTVVRIGDKRKR